MAKKLTAPAVMATKRVCGITRAEFQAGARPLSVSVNGTPMIAGVKQFSTGSFGWYLTGKTVIDIGGTPVSVQIGMNMTVIGSKEVS